MNIEQVEFQKISRANIKKFYRNVEDGTETEVFCPCDAFNETFLRMNEFDTALEIEFMRLASREYRKIFGNDGFDSHNGIVEDLVSVGIDYDDAFEIAFKIIRQDY